MNFRCYQTTRDQSGTWIPCSSASESSTFDAEVYIDPGKPFQAILGFGGAFTEASAVTLAKLSHPNQQAVLRAYFDPVAGHGYSLCRTHINSCDFGLGNYACADQPGDTSLASFNLRRESEALLPMIRAAIAMRGAPIRLLASPWSPPAWMKTNGQMNGGGELKPEYRQVWADYYVRFIQAFAAEGLPIWGLTVQNEPAATQRWDSCCYSAGQERDFVRDYLGPTLHRAGLHEVKLLIWDHNRDELVQRAAAIYNDPDAAAFVWGTGYHWYGPEKADNLTLHHDAWPEKALLFTEGCQEFGPHLGSWAVAERYARAMIRDFNRWNTGWIDWNLLLDTTGGPNHTANLCSAPILADVENDRVLIQPSYHAIGHFARHVRPGAHRILCATTGETFEATAFQNSDGSLALVILNPTDAPIRLRINFTDTRHHLLVPAHSISTLLSPAPIQSPPPALIGGNQHICHHEPR